MIQLGKESGVSSIELSKESGFDATHLHHTIVGLGWDPNRAIFANQEFDLDASALAFGMNGQPLGDEYFVYHKRLFTPDRTITHTGDDKSGHGPGVDEALIANLIGMPHAGRVVFMVNIYDGPNRGQTFEHVNNAFVNVTIDGQVRLRYDLDDDPRSRDYSSVALADFVRPSLTSPWSFRVLAQGFPNQRAMLRAFGLAA